MVLYESYNPNQIVYSISNFQILIFGYEKKFMHLTPSLMGFS